MKSVLLLLACLCGWVQAHGQTPPALAVTAEVVGVGACENGMNGYYLKLMVKNVSSAIRKFGMYNCSWYNSWTISKQGLLLGDDYGCERDYPIEIKLVPGQQVNFYSFLRVVKLSGQAKLPDQLKVLADYSGVRFGFTESSLDSLFDASIKEKPGTTYWSNPVSLAFANNFYEVQPPSAK